MQRLVLLFTLTALSACSSEDARIEKAQNQNSASVNAGSSQDSSQENQVTVVNASVEHGDNPNTYKLNWSTKPAGQKVRIEWSTKPNFLVGSGTEIATTDKNEFVWSAAGATQRRYFTIVPESGLAVSTAVRLLPLEGGRNFRDLGGYTTNDGLTVKWGTVFRSGVMNELTERDYGYLSDLSIGTVCDFRDARERNNEPTRWQAGNIDYKVFADPPKRDARQNPMFAALLDPDSTPEMIKTAMANGYSDIAKGEIEGYTAMFAELAAGRVPLAFNCSAGKDRAGTAAALILTALGVPEETVVHDYALSDQYVDYMSEFLSPEKRAEAQADPDHPYGFLFKMPKEKIAPLMASDPLYIETSFANLKQEYGSVLAFIQQELKVSNQDLANIRATLLN